jgi:16S rRNA processing protein RimM
MTVQAVTLGKLVKAVGLKGEVKLLPGPDFWPGALEADQLDIISGQSATRSVSVEKARVKGRTYVLKLSGIDDRDASESLVGKELVVSLDSLDTEMMPEDPLPCQLIGLEVRLEDGTVKGQIFDLLLGEAQKCFIVEDGSRRFLIPNAPEVVREIDIENGFIVVDPPEGLFDFEW